MGIRSDPENNEIHALLELADFDGKHVLEVGCGDGRLTWRYAELAEHVTAIDPYERSIRRASRDIPDPLRDHVEFHSLPFEDFAANSESSRFDVVILSWSLC